jgi:hypothetical protein
MVDFRSGLTLMNHPYSCFAVQPKNTTTYGDLEKWPTAGHVGQQLQAVRPGGRKVTWGSHREPLGGCGDGKRGNLGRS